ncbi:putative glycoside hydrolase family 25 protein [Paratrimastix pyriformis]|uniref:Glycoside hydrolase family 25 protein n=1 Tax=Paratrimastix pyriformis TaxID=342808 RepID=A0ABQ8UC13_9EUKA|nr:putative glycoside hydrolase family 25 protein [Paratrimastix pyriformis]
MQKLLLAALFVGVAFATLGVDVSQNFYVPVFKCLHDNGYDFAIIRAYCSTGRPDDSSVHTVYNAWEGGMKHVDIYMFPCPKCGNPAGQVRDAIAHQRAYNTTYGMFWLDIEEPSYWMDQGSNRNFIQGLIDEARAEGQVVGIYTNLYQWSSIAGDWSGAAGYPLWWAYYDGSPSYDHWQNFGGWSKPAIKQFQGDATVCGADIDRNWYP